MLKLRRPTYSQAISTTALFVALGGTSYAAIKLPNNSVGSAQIKSNAVASSEIKNGSVAEKDLASAVRSKLAAGGEKGSTGAQGPRGDTGATGPAGAKGDTGATGAKGDTGAQGPKGDPGTPGTGGGTTRVARIGLSGGPLTIAPGQTVSVPLTGASWAGVADEVLSPLSFRQTVTASSGTCTLVTGSGNPGNDFPDIRYEVGGELISSDQFSYTEPAGPTFGTTVQTTARGLDTIAFRTAAPRTVTAKFRNFCTDSSFTVSAIAIDVYRLAG